MSFAEPKPTNPFARQVASLRQALLDQMKPDDMAAVARALIDKAAGGDTSAARLLLSYVLGKPTATPDPDRLDADEWDKLKETVPMMQEMPALVQTPEPSMPLTTVRTARPAMAKELSRILADGLRQPVVPKERVELEMVEDDEPPAVGAEPRPTNGPQRPGGGCFTQAALVDSSA